MEEKGRDRRRRVQEECTLSDGLSVINCQTTDTSKWGLGVLITYEDVQIKEGDVLSVCVKNVSWTARARVIWIKKDVKKNATRLGLELFSRPFPL
jgi:hypothetical protein